MDRDGPLERSLRIMMTGVAVMALGSLVLEYGLYLPDRVVAWLHGLDYFIIALFILELFIRGAFQWRDRSFWRSHGLQVILLVLFSIQFVLLPYILNLPLMERGSKFVDAISMAKLYIVLAQSYLVLQLIVRSIHAHRSLTLLRITPGQMLVLSYLTLILAGSLILALPRFQAQPGSVGFLDVLFTSTSAVCVTGLITVDTATAWSQQGQIFILLLFQIGGLGIMTYTAAFALLLGRGLGMRERAVMQDILSIDALGKIGRLLVSIVAFTFVAELLGAIILFFFWRGDFGVLQALEHSVFHAVSAFCNAGFSLFTENLAACHANTGMTITVAALIVLGGLGFPVLAEMLDAGTWRRKRGRPRPRFSIHSRIVLSFSLGLILLGALWIYLAESLFAGGHAAHGVLDALFHSVTARTAGFNTVDISQYGTSTHLLMMLLMLIGASPGSAGGGMKTVTVALIVLYVWCVWKRRQDTELGFRKLPDETVRNAFLIGALYLFMVGVATLALSVTEGAPLEVILFEEISAMGTVGLSLGLTPALSDPGKVIIMLSMLVGRIGPLTLLLALGRRASAGRYQYPREDVVLG